MHRKLASGTQGSWFATVNLDPYRGLRFPCVRKDFIINWPDYHDPIVGQPLQPGYLEAVMAGRVLLVDVAAKQRKYIGLYEVVQIVHNQQGLRFRFHVRLL